MCPGLSLFPLVFICTFPDWSMEASGFCLRGNVYFLLVLCSFSSYGVHLGLEFYLEGNPFTLVEMKIYYQYTQAGSWVSSASQFTCMNECKM